MIFVIHDIFSKLRSSKETKKYTGYPDRPGFSATTNVWGETYLTEDAIRNKQKERKRQDVDKAIPKFTFLQHFVKLLKDKIVTVDPLPFLDSYLFELHPEDDLEILRKNITPELFFDSLLKRDQMKKYFCNILQPQVRISKEAVDKNCPKCGIEKELNSRSWWTQSAIVQFQELEDLGDLNLCNPVETIKDQLETHFNNLAYTSEVCSTPNCDEMIKKTVVNSLQNHQDVLLVKSVKYKTHRNQFKADKIPLGSEAEVSADGSIERYRAICAIDDRYVLYICSQNIWYIIENQKITAVNQKSIEECTYYFFKNTNELWD